MSNSDSTGANRPAPKLTKRLPSILGVSIKQATFKRPKLEFVESAYKALTEVLAFEVQLDSPFPVSMDATPVLYVGSQVISHAECSDEDNLVRFLAFPDEWKLLKVDAPIALGWPERGPQGRRESKYRYEPPKRAKT